MGIYIKGMEMPSNCAECPLNHDAECAVKNCMVIDDCYVRRAFWCPLVPVPYHGRLIDADALVRDNGIKEIPEYYEVVRDAPTIIPADVPENNVGNIPAEEGET